MRKTKAQRRSLRMAQVAPPFESVPPEGYGGTEGVITALTEELVARGHDVTLFAAGDSRTSARLVPEVEQAVWHRKMSYRDPSAYTALVLGKLCREIDRFDVVHSHLEHVGFPLARLSSPPVVTTLHGRLDLPEMEPLYREFTDVPLVSISDAQRVPAPDANWVATVHHGIQLEQYTFNPEAEGYLAFLGRFSPEKGLEAAIRVAERAGLPIKVAGRMPLPNPHDPDSRTDRDYFENVVQPLLKDRRVEMIGEVDGEEKDGFLREAAALLFPIQWPEPFGLVMVEALACGTPVLALRRGSVPEVVEEGVTGFIRDDEDGLVEAVGRLGELDRARCRREAERRFSAASMADRYEQVYEMLVE